MGSTFFNKIQYAKETTRGTAVAASQMWVGQMQPITSDRKPVYPAEHIGVRADAFRGVIHQYLYTNTLSTEHGAFQHLPMLFSSLKGAVTPVQQTTAQGDYLWAFAPSMTAANSPDAFTIEFGDDAGAYEVEYCMFDSIRLSGQIAQGADASPVRVEGSFFGRQISTSTFTGSISPRTLEPINAKLAALYLDTTWAGVGGTELSNVLRSFDIEILTGNHPKFAGKAGQRYFNSHAEGVLAVTATFGIEGGSTAISQFSNHLSGTFGVARLQISGSQIGSGVNYDLKVDIGGTWEDATPIGSSDRGDNIGSLVMHGYADKSATYKIVDVNVITNHNTY